MKNCLVSLCLLISFGIPTLLGMGLHGFLPCLMSESVSAVCGHHDHTGTDNTVTDAIGADQTSCCHSSDCVICLYFAQGKSIPVSLAVLTVDEVVVDLDLLKTSCMALACSTLHSGRSPPLA